MSNKRHLADSEASAFRDSKKTCTRYLRAAYEKEVAATSETFSSLLATENNLFPGLTNGSVQYESPTCFPRLSTGEEALGVDVREEWPGFAPTGDFVPTGLDWDTWAQNGTSETQLSVPEFDLETPTYLSCSGNEYDADRQASSINLQQEMQPQLPPFQAAENEYGYETPGSLIPESEDPSDHLQPTTSLMISAEKMQHADSTTGLEWNLTSQHVAGSTSTPTGTAVEHDRDSPAEIDTAQFDVCFGVVSQIMWLWTICIDHS